MAYAIEVLPSAARQIAKLPADVRKRIARRIDSLAVNPRPAGVKILAADEQIHRLRVGDYRVLYQVKDDVLLIIVVKVGHRRDVDRHR